MNKGRIVLTNEEQGIVTIRCKYCKYWDDEEGCKYYYSVLNEHPNIDQSLPIVDCNEFKRG